MSQVPASAPPVHPAPIPFPDRGIFPLAAGFYGVVTLFSLGYATFSNSLGSLLGPGSPTPANWLGALAVGLGIVGLCHIAVRALPFVARASTAMSELLGPMTYRQCAGLALMSGFAEELLFRGALWGHLGLWGTTLLFGLVHVVPRRALAGYPLFAAVAGLLMGFLRDGSGSVFPPMLAHALVNGLNLCWLESRRRRHVAAVLPPT